MNNQRLQIDPEQFALNFIKSLNIQMSPEKVDIEAASKEALAVYLSAFYLAERFNSTENKFFEDPDQSGIRSSYQRILSELNKY